MNFLSQRQAQTVVLAVSLLLVRRDRVMNQCLYTLLAKVLLQFVPEGRADNI
ncbi:hypothetical protein D3C80_2008760 [compost metagenome]